MDSSPNIRMIDVADKPVTIRQATAKGRIVMEASTFVMLKEGNLPKGDALSPARLAGITAAKQTPYLIPLCHPLLIDDINVEFSLDEQAAAVDITATVKGTGKTGFEMEAMTAVAISGLTIYDMCKAVDSTMRIENIRLAQKSGGKSGTVILE